MSGCLLLAFAVGSLLFHYILFILSSIVQRSISLLNCLARMVLNRRRRHNASIHIHWSSFCCSRGPLMPWGLAPASSACAPDSCSPLFVLALPSVGSGLSGRCLVEDRHTVLGGLVASTKLQIYQPQRSTEQEGKDDDKDAIGAPLPRPFPSHGSAQAFHGWHVHGRLHHLRISSLLLSIQFQRSAPVKERERAVSLPLAAHHTQRTNHHPTTGFSTHFFTPAVFFSLASRADPASYFLQPMDPFNSIHLPACQPAKPRCEMSVRAALRRLLRVLFFIS